MTRTRERRPATNGAPPETRRRQAASPAQDSATDRPSAPIARAVGLAPSGGRTLWLWVVGRYPIPGCGGNHAHRGGPNGGLRRAGCGGGEYCGSPPVRGGAR